MANSLKDGLNVPDELAALAANTPGGVQSGEVIASAGSILTIEFDNNYSATPDVVISVVGGLSEQPLMSISGASVDVEVASASGTWIAFGNK